MNEKILLASIRDGFRIALKICLQDEFPKINQLYSSKFVAEVSTSIHRSCFAKTNKLNVIAVSDSGEKTKGEWVLDACITEVKNGFNNKILFAMESESNTSKNAFDEDFAKLVHFNANHRLYLNGLNHTQS